MRAGWGAIAALAALTAGPGLAGSLPPLVVPVGDGRPVDLGLSPDGTSLYVVTQPADGRPGGALRTFSAETGRPGTCAAVAVGGLPGGLAVSPTGAMVYVTGAGDALGVTKVMVNRCETQGEEVEKQTSAGLAFSPDGAWVYAVRGGAPEVLVFDAKWKTVEARIGGLGRGGNRIAVAPDGSFGWVTGRDGKLYKLDLKARKVLKTIDADGWDVAVAPDGAHVYVGGGEEDAAIKVVSAATDEIERSIDLGFDSKGLAVSPDGKTLYAALPKNRQVAVVDLGTGAIAGTLKAGRAPTVLALAPGGRRLYVANGAESTVSILSTVLASATREEPAAAADAESGGGGEVNAEGGAALAGTKLVIAVANFEAQGLSDSAASIATDWLRDGLVRGAAFRMIERKNMEAIMSEQALQQTGCTDQDCIVKIGKLLNVQRMVMGSLGKFEDHYVVSVRMVDVESGQVIWSGSARGKKIDDVESGIRRIAMVMSQPGPAIPSAPASSGTLSSAH